MTKPTSADVSETTRRDDVFPGRNLETLRSGSVRVPDPTRLVHLQLRRYAGCPICSLHLRTFARRHDELVAAGIVEVAVFHSSADDLSKVHMDQPFYVVPDPDKRLYSELGVGASPSALLSPRVWLTGLRAMSVGAASRATAGSSDGAMGLPGDFLIAPDGRIVACYRGKHADDQWSVDQLLEIAGRYAKGE